MNDLISRKAVRDGMMKYGFHASDMTVHEFVEDELPSVPAVPLNKLCEWLHENALLSYKTPISVAGWKYELTQWMEEQNGTD